LDDKKAGLAQNDATRPPFRFEATADGKSVFARYKAMGSKPNRTLCINGSSTRSRRVLEEKQQDPHKLKIVTNIFNSNLMERASPY